MQFSPIDPREFLRVCRMLARDAVLSPLRRYVLYSIVIHVVVIVALSVSMFLPKTKASASMPQEAAPAAAPAEPVAEPAPPAPDALKPTGKAEDYYGREKIETAKPSEIPRNPFDVDKADASGLDAPEAP